MDEEASLEEASTSLTSLMEDEKNIFLKSGDETKTQPPNTLIEDEKKVFSNPLEGVSKLVDSQPPNEDEKLSLMEDEKGGVSKLGDETILSQPPNTLIEDEKNVSVKPLEGVSKLVLSQPPNEDEKLSLKSSNTLMEDEKGGVSKHGDETRPSQPPNTLIEDEKTVQEGVSKLVDETTPPKEVEKNVNSKSSNTLTELEDEKNVSSTKTEEYDPKNVHYEGQTAIYTDPKSGYQYKWCNETNQWLAKTDVTYGFEDDTHTYTDTDGVKYFWDKEKNAWFPKIDDEFMARYQMSYGFVDNTTTTTSKDDEKKTIDDILKKALVSSSSSSDEEMKDVTVSSKKEKLTKSVKRKNEPPPPPTWFEMDDQQNTKVYVNNLPTDITEEEFVDLMQKCGLVMRDPQSGKMKIKLYTVPETDILKGDALCTYIKIESVELALNLLDGYLYRGKRLTVERAKFQMKGEYNPSLKPKKKRRKDKDKIKKMQEKLFDWRPEKMRGERSKHERVVIVKNLFEPSLFDKDVSLILEFQQDLREECGKCGQVKRVVLYDRHPEGVVQISMKEPEEADEVVKLLNGRWFNQRQLTAQIWDGKTKYKIAETDAQISERLETWEEFLESEQVADKLKTSIITNNEKIQS